MFRLFKFQDILTMHQPLLLSFVYSIVYWYQYCVLDPLNLRIRGHATRRRKHVDVKHPQLCWDELEYMSIKVYYVDDLLTMHQLLFWSFVYSIVYWNQYCVKDSLNWRIRGHATRRRKHVDVKHPQLCWNELE